MRLSISLMIACAALFAMGYVERAIVAARKSIHANNADFPSYDAEVEYIENTVGAYIDTGFVQTVENVEVLIRIYIPSGAFDSASYDALFGNDVVDSTGKFVLAKQQKYTYVFWRLGLSTNVGLSSTRIPVYMDAHIWAHEGEYEWTIGGSTRRGTYEGSILGARNPMLVFASIHDNGTVSLPSIGGYRIARVQIAEGGTMVRDMIPVRVGDDGAMYDMVDGKLYVNRGSGKLIAGPDL